MNDCEKLTIIPQFTNTCWFNAILMVSLYSQGLKKIMKIASRHWDITKNRFYKLIKIILQGNNLKDFYNKISPEIILFELLKRENPIEAKLFKLKLKENFYNSAGFMEYIINYLRYCNINVIDITYIYNGNNRYYIPNISKYIKRVISPSNKESSYFQIDWEKFNLEKDATKIKDNTKTPDVIILFHQDLINNSHVIIANEFKNEVFGLLNPLHKHVGNTFFLNMRPNSDKIKNYEDTIILNDVTYKLDSCLITNYNNDLGNHAIAGITCNNKKYVYNGWTYELINNNKCSLMKYDWDLKKNKNFCLDYKKCNFSKKVNKKDLCFNFTKGYRILIYVREKEEQVNLNSPLLTYESIKRDIPMIINNNYEIDKLKISELKRQLSLLGVTDTNKTKPELQELLRKKMIINY